MSGELLPNGSDLAYFGAETGEITYDVCYMKAMFRLLTISTALVVASSAAGLALSKAHFQVTSVYASLEAVEPETRTDATFIVPDHVPAPTRAATPVVPVLVEPETDTAVATPEPVSFEDEPVVMWTSSAVETSIRPRARGQRIAETAAVRAVTDPVLADAAPVFVRQGTPVETIRRSERSVSVARTDRGDARSMSPTYMIGVFR